MNVSLGSAAAPARAWPAGRVGVAQPAMPQVRGRTPPEPAPGSRSRRQLSNDDLRFAHGVEDLAIEQIAAQARVETLDETVLPRTARRGPRFAFQFTPQSGSWLKAIEPLFSRPIQRRSKWGVFRSIVEFHAAINRFLAETALIPTRHRRRSAPDPGVRVRIRSMPMPPGSAGVLSKRGCS